jgi:hypothetical protein
MAWEIEYTDEFEQWWNALSEEEQISLDASVRLLEERGPNLGLPHSSGIERSKHSHSANFGPSTKVDPIGDSTRSTPDAWRSC